MIMIDDDDWWLWFMIVIDDYDWWWWLMIMIDDYDYRLSIIDYQLTFFVVFSGKASGGKFSKKKRFFWNFLQNTKTVKTRVFCGFVYP